MMKGWNDSNTENCKSKYLFVIAIVCIIIRPVQCFQQFPQISYGRTITNWKPNSLCYLPSTIQIRTVDGPLKSNHARLFSLPPEKSNNEEGNGLTQLLSPIRESAVILTQKSPIEEEDVIEKETFDISTVSEGNNELGEVSSFKILALCWFVAALSALDRVAMSVAILPLSSELHFTETIKGEISSVFSLGYGIGIIPFGLIVAAFSPSVIMGIGVALWSIATIGTPIAASMTNIIEMPTANAITYVVENIAPLLFIRAIMGASESVVLPATQRILANWIPLEKKSSAIATIYSGFQIGTVCAYLLSPFVMDSFGGWRGMFYLYGAIGLLWLIPWTLLASDFPSDLQRKATGKDLSSNNSEESISQGAMSVEIENFNIDSNISKNNDSQKAWDDAVGVIKSAPWKDLIQSKGVWAMIIAHAASNWGLYNSLSWTPTFYSEHYGLNVRESAFLSVLPSVVGAVGGLFAGKIADSFIANFAAESRENRTNIRKLFQGIALLGPAACLLTLGNHIPDEPITAQALLTGVVGLQAFNAAGFGAATQEKADKWSGLLYSITSLPGVMFGSFGVYVTGQILDITNHDWSWMFNLNAVVNVIGALAFIGLYDSKREFE